MHFYGLMGLFMSPFEPLCNAFWPFKTNLRAEKEKYLIKRTKQRVTLHQKDCSQVVHANTSSMEVVSSKHNPYCQTIHIYGTKALKRVLRPRLKIHFLLLSGEMISRSNAKYLTHEYIETEYTTKSRLKIRNFGPEDIGVYKCTCKNIMNAGDRVEGLVYLALSKSL